MRVGELKPEAAREQVIKRYGLVLRFEGYIAQRKYNLRRPQFPCGQTQS